MTGSSNPASPAGDGAENDGAENDGAENDDGLARAANIVGALALVLTDRMTEAAQAAAGSSVSGAVALSALEQILRELRIDVLRQVLGLTHSGAVRLVDRLEQAGLAERGPGQDGRSTTVLLTAPGRRAAAAVTEARAAALGDALAALDAAEQRQLGRPPEQFRDRRVLVGLKRGAGATRWTCRLCDTTACGRAAGRCPVAGPDPPTW